MLLYTFFPHTFRFSQTNFLQEGFGKLGVALTHLLGKVMERKLLSFEIPIHQFLCPQAVGICLTLCLLGVGIWGLTMLTVEFQYVEFLPSNSPLRQWFQIDQEYFPTQGEMGSVYLKPENLKESVNHTLIIFLVINGTT